MKQAGGEGNKNNVTLLPLHFLHRIDGDFVQFLRAGLGAAGIKVLADKSALSTVRCNNGYFLGAQQSASWTALPLQNGTSVKDELKLAFFARCQIPNPMVYLKLDGKWRWSSQLPKPLACSLGRLKPGKHRVEILLTDLQGHALQRQSFDIRSVSP